MCVWKFKTIHIASLLMPAMEVVPSTLKQNLQRIHPIKYNGKSCHSPGLAYN